MAAPSINPTSRITPMVYCYTTPGVAENAGWSKIGYTEKQTVEERVKQQTHTAGIKAKIEWRDNAMYKDGSGEYFHDSDFHGFLVRRKNVVRRPKTEWFEVEPMPARGYFDEFASRSLALDEGSEQTEYVLRTEQADAVAAAKKYFDGGGTEFLWNAKPRFGKTLSAYDLVQQMDTGAAPMKVLVVTNRPSIANSWADDFAKFIGWRGRLCFVSENDSVKNRPGVYSRDEYLKAIQDLSIEDKPGMVAFESLQGLKGSVYFGGGFDKLKWISEIEFDLLVVDEAQEGVDTMRTERAFDNIKRKHTLFLSGTPFKALADGRFTDAQIYNWSYVDEQHAKQEWDGDEFNPYETLPELKMFTYQMSLAIEEEVRRGAAIAEEGTYTDYAFDLNEFFSTYENGEFRYKEDVAKFLDALTTQEKYPFSTPELREELPHTMWLLERVASARAMAKMLKEHPVFGEYEMVLAAGDGRLDEDDEAKRSYDKVKEAIAKHPKTITLSVGQLTVGVTVPEWTGVLMLSNMKSAQSYVQAAFRVQNPYEDTVMVDGKPARVRKERAYVFDFDPARTLTIFDEFANNLSAASAGGRGTAETRKENIRQLLNFFPVLGEDEEGRMVEVDAQQVLSIPRRLKSAEVVRRGFMSNYLLDNISNVFAAPRAVTEIIESITPVKKNSFDAHARNLERMGDVPVDAQGNVDVPEEVVIGKSKDLFGHKVYEAVAEDVEDIVDGMRSADEFGKVMANVKEMGTALKGAIAENVINPAFEEYGLKKGKRKQLVREADDYIDREVAKLSGDFEQQVRIAQIELEKKQGAADSPKEMDAATREYEYAFIDARNALINGLDALAKDSAKSQPVEVTEKLERLKAQETKDSVEDSVRAHLRGFARTIPSFIMAYGDENLTLANFDDYTEDDVFFEVTGITEEQFRFLRDGGEYTNPETGEVEHFEGGLFDETVFNDSIQEFLRKRAELANYFDESNSEDIFDYIPPQKTNQIFTPRWVVVKMVDALEEENPGCFDNPDATFADLYMKSGLYITEVVKRLFNSKGLRKAYPKDGERIRHILQKQVYGMAPTRIIYLIATNYILGFDERLKAESANFVEADAAAAAKDGTLQELVGKHFG